jgi:predicted methyltransferase
MKLNHLIYLLSFVSLSASADDHKVTTEDLIKQAMIAELRTESDTDRDRNRRPVQTLKFFGLEDDMKVVELIPAGGWYTKILAPVLKEKGELIVAIGTSQIEKVMANNDSLSAIKFDAADSKSYLAENDQFYTLENADLDVKEADMVLTFRNYHGFNAAGREAMNDAAWKALKMGGIYGVLDHTRRHMEGDNDENSRRFDPVKAILEIQAAGFELVDYSDLHYHADDELEYEVGRRSVTGNTDRWTLKFKKVKK